MYLDLRITIAVTGMTLIVVVFKTLPQNFI